MMEPAKISFLRGRPRRRSGAPAPRLAYAALLCLTLALAGGLLLTLVQPALAEPSSTPTSLVLKGKAKEQVGDLRGRAQTVQDEIDGLDLELEHLTEDYNALTVRMEEINRELAQLRRNLDLAETNHAFRMGRVEERLRAAYKTGDDDFLQIILATRDFNDLVKRVRLIYLLANSDQEIATEFEVSADEISLIQEEIRSKKSEELNLQVALTQKQEEIEQRLADRQATLAGLDEEISRVIEEERVRQEEERRRLEAELRARLAQQFAAQQAAQSGPWVGPLPSSPEEVLNQLIETAVAYLGIPYQWGGKRPATGFDCSGLTKWVYAQHGVELAHWSRDQSQMGAPVDPGAMKAGDLLAFGTPVHHVGIYVGDGNFIHAPRTGDVVRIQSLSKRKDLTAIRRFPLVARTAAPRWE